MRPQPLARRVRDAARAVARAVQAQPGDVQAQDAGKVRVRRRRRRERREGSRRRLFLITGSVRERARAGSVVGALHLVLLLVALVLVALVVGLRRCGERAASVGLGSGQSRSPEGGDRGEPREMIRLGTLSVPRVRVVVGRRGRRAHLDVRPRISLVHAVARARGVREVLRELQRTVGRVVQHRVRRRFARRPGRPRRLFRRSPAAVDAAAARGPRRARAERHRVQRSAARAPPSPDARPSRYALARVAEARPPKLRHRGQRASRRSSRRASSRAWCLCANVSFFFRGLKFYTTRTAFPRRPP